MCIRDSDNVYRLFVKAETVLALNSPVMQFTMYMCILAISWLDVYKRQVFGLEEEWAGRFDGMAVPPPVWYGCSDMTVWNVIWFSHMMHHSVDPVSYTHLAAIPLGKAGA